MNTPNFKKTLDPSTDFNFSELRKVFFDLFDGAAAKSTQAALVAGDNQISPTVPFPRGRIITYQDAAANLFDKGLNSIGKWVINASAPCNIRLSFF